MYIELDLCQRILTALRALLTRIYSYEGFSVPSSGIIYNISHLRCVTYVNTQRLDFSVLLEGSMEVPPKWPNTSCMRFNVSLTGLCITSPEGLCFSSEWIISNISCLRGATYFKPRRLDFIVLLKGSMEVHLEWPNALCVRPSVSSSRLCTTSPEGLIVSTWWIISNISRSNNQTPHMRDSMSHH